MKAMMQARQGQHLVLTPQLLQSIRLLQLDAMTLEQEIAQALANNPLLERVEDADLSDEDALADCTSPEAMDHTPSPTEADTTRRYDEDDCRGGQRSLAADRDSTDGDAIAATVPNATQDVRSSIRQQLQHSRLRDTDLAAADWLLDETDEAGYLRESIDALRLRMPLHLGVGSNLEYVRQLILHSEPAGICAFSLSECLAAQIEAFDPSVLRELALKAVRYHLDLLAERELGAFAKAMTISLELAQETVRLVLSLDPKPALAGPDLRSIVVIPEVNVSLHDGHWHVDLNPLTAPQIRVDPKMEQLIESCVADPRAQRVRELMHQARWLTRGLAMRYDTLLRVANVIVRKQSGFLEQGNEAMSPLTLREVADELHIHESTVSRIAAGKYLQTPRGTFELRHFFSTRLAGAVVANSAVQAMVKRLIDQENPKAPLADDKIVTLLARQGVKIARRTVAKYRDILHIAPARSRQDSTTPAMYSMTAH